MLIISAAPNLKHSVCFPEECWYLIIIIAASPLIGNFTLENRCESFSVLNVNPINPVTPYAAHE